MPGGIGPVNDVTIAACTRQERVVALPANANEIFYHLDGRRVFYDRAAAMLYFVGMPGDRVARTIARVLAGMGREFTCAQLHLDAHGFFAGAYCVALGAPQADPVLVALRLAGIRTTVG
jgi:hypothetical protein